MKINNELFVTVFGLVAVYLLYASGQATIMSFVALALIGYSIWCGYHFKGGKSYKYAILPLISFVIYGLSASIGGIFCTVMMIMWVTVVLGVAYHCNTATVAKNPTTEIKPLGKYCSGCGGALEISARFCSSCGKEQQ